MTDINGARVYAWSEQPIDRPMPLIDRKRIIGEQMMISQVTLHRGFKVATHSHANEQFAVVLSGRIRFGIGADGAVVAQEPEGIHAAPRFNIAQDPIEGVTVAMDIG